MKGKQLLRTFELESEDDCMGETSSDKGLDHPGEDCNEEACFAVEQQAECRAQLSD